MIRLAYDAHAGEQHGHVTTHEWRHWIIAVASIITMTVTFITCWWFSRTTKQSLAKYGEIMAHNRTTRTKLDAALNDAETANRTKSEFLAYVLHYTYLRSSPTNNACDVCSGVYSFLAHELRNPLHAIISLSDFQRV
jgi:signal transduction histidine kinase